MGRNGYLLNARLGNQPFSERQLAAAFRCIQCGVSSSVLEWDENTARVTKNDGEGNIASVLHSHSDSFHYCPYCNAEICGDDLK